MNEILERVGSESVKDPVLLLDTGTLSSQQTFPFDIRNKDYKFLLFTTEVGYQNGPGTVLMKYEDFINKVNHASWDAFSIFINLTITDGRELRYGTVNNRYYPLNIWNQPDQGKSTYSATRYLIYGIY